jgi:septal ring factor EnvC (AmiA/AmiB activator)
VAHKKKQILEEQKQRESGFVRQVAEKNTIISGLRTDITSLQTELQNHDEIIEEYETSFGRILAQSVKLSTKCIMNTMQYLGLYSNRSKRIVYSLYFSYVGTNFCSCMTDYIL